jgi:ABC-type sugar transport system ATPase subunit
VADRFVILDRGSIAADYQKRELTQEQLVDKMLQLATTGSLDE